MRSRMFLWVGTATAILLIGIGATSFLLASRGESQEDKSFLEKTNDKLSRIGQPTVPADYEFNPSPVPDRERSTATPGPSPTPIVPECAKGTISGTAEIVAQHGSAQGASCARAGNYLYFVTDGVDAKPGGIAVFACTKECSPESSLDAGSQWTFHEAPVAIPMKILSFVDPATFILAPGQICFDLRSGEYKTTPPCMVEPTIPPGPPWEVTPYIEPTPVDLSTPESP